MPVSAILLISFFALLIFNVPVGYSLGCSALITILLAMDLPMEIIAQRFFVTFDSFTMRAIPLFMLAGSLMNGSGISERIITLADRGVGHIRGGLAQGNILASMLFAGISGSAAADASGLGSVLIPAMRKRGYDDDFSVVVTAASSTIGPIIPPQHHVYFVCVHCQLVCGTAVHCGSAPWNYRRPVPDDHHLFHCKKEKLSRQ